MLEILRSPFLFPILSILLGVCGAVRWALEGNFGQAAYWVLGAAITVIVTFFIKR